MRSILHERIPGAVSDELKQLYAQTMQEIEEGQIVKGRVISLTAQEVIVDVGYKSEGAIALSEFADPSALKVGDEVEVFLEAVEDDSGMIVLSKRKADRLQGWERIVANAKEGDMVEGRVTRKVKGGLMVDVGIEAFLPASLAGFRGFPNVNQLLGQSLKFIIVKISKQRKNIVLSRRDYLLKEKEITRAKVLETLTIGERKTGMVKNITDFGAFIDLGGVDGLLHIADISWSRIAHPSEILKVGDRVEIVILNFDKDTHKISLGLKQLQPSPWGQVEQKYPIGTRVKGRVVNLMPYGAFVEVEKGIEGLVHVSELSWTRRVSHPSELLQVGQEIEAVVLNANAKDQKLSLGVRQTEDNPWTKVAEHFPVGTKVTGKIKSLTDFGAFVELEAGIEGLLHNADLSWTRKINHPSELLKKGQTVDCVVLSCDAENRRIGLGIKQLIPDPWVDITTHYPVGSTVEGRVTKVANFGVFVELGQDVEGLVHISEADVPPNTKLEDRFKVGSPLQVRVIRIEDAERKIGLSCKQVDG